MKTDLVKGFKDYSGEEAEKRTEIKKILMDIFEKYNFEPAETPIIEYEEFVKGDNKDDEAVSDIFKLKDRGKRNLALRYEFTFQLKRLMKNKKLPYKRYQVGEVFRDEPVSTKRFRQFTQCDVDIVGSTIKDEAEVLAIAKEVLNALKIDCIIYIGNKKIFKGLIKVLFGFNDKKSINEITRYFDKLDKQKPSEIIKDIERNEKKSSAIKKIQKVQLKNIFLPLLNTLKNNDLEGLKEYYLGILKNREQEETYETSLFKEGYDEVIKLIEYCKNYGIKLQFNGALVRGLSYYNENVFEVKSNIKETICAGGSFMFNNVQSTGISFGLDRISLLSKIKSKKEKFLVVSLNQDKKSIEIAKKLRKQKGSVTLFYGKPSKSLEYANSKKINKVIFIGEKEIKKGKFKIKDMKTGKEKSIKL